MSLKILWIATLAVLLPSAGFCQIEKANPTVNATESDPEPAQVEKKWNEFENDFATLRIGGGFLVDTVSYQQDAISEQQMQLSPDVKLRDMRLLFKGLFKKAPNISYTAGYMYDGAKDEWFFRQTGLIFNFADGSLFVGRTKEGFSTSKIMVGYNGWTNERSAANDAFLPILADGIKWTASLFDEKLVYNLGVFTNSWTPRPQSYVKNDEHAAGRLVWLPFSKNDERLLHLAFELRHGNSLDGHLQYRSKPESFPAQEYAIDTGKFPASSSDMLGLEAYFRHGPLTLGSEYYFNQVKSEETDNPFFQGGEIFIAYLTTGEVRGYNRQSAQFEGILPSKPMTSFFDVSKGAWEFVLRYSYADLNSKLIDGGRFQRITPMVNWHINNNTRLEFVYGYSQLDRFNDTGYTHYFQTRLQLQL